MAFDVVIGSCNPVALPVAIEFDGPRAIGHATYSETFEGAPGWVHGAVLAGAFDVVLTAANVIAGAAGPTRSLTLRYLRPTTINRPLVYEAEVTAVDGRRVRFRVEARDEKEKIGEGFHERRIIHVARFVARLAEKMR